MPYIAEEDRDYVCTLDEASLKKAKEELNEDPHERLAQVDTFRQWVKKQPHFKCPTDTLFLLHYLRGAKFSQLRAREKLEGMLAARAMKITAFQNVDVQEATIIKHIKTGGTLLSPKRDRDGRILMLSNIGRSDPKTTPEERFRVSTVLMTYISQDENIQKSMPMRMKAFHYYNLGTFIEIVMSVVSQVFQEKFRKRIHVHSTMESVYKQIPMECLPAEYLPDDYTGENPGTMDDIAEDFVKKIQTPEFRDYLLERTNPEYTLDETKRVKNDEPAASFRKLNVD